MPDQHETPHTSSPHSPVGDSTTDAETRDRNDYLSHLLRFSEKIDGTRDAAEQFCQEVARVTENRVQLSLNEPLSSRLSAPFPVILPVRLRNSEIVSLSFFRHPKTSSPQFSLNEMDSLASFCQMMLSMFEQTAYIKKRLEGISLPDPDCLSKRENEVLTLMGHRYDEDAIARALRVTLATVRKHRQHIYAKLGVHCEQDAILVAYQLQLFAPLDDISSQYGLRVVR